MGVTGVSGSRGLTVLTNATEQDQFGIAMYLNVLLLLLLLLLLSLFIYLFIIFNDKDDTFLITVISTLEIVKREKI